MPTRINIPAAMLLRSIGGGVFLCAIGFLLTGCRDASEGEPVQSSLHPAGPAASAIASIWWLMFWVCTAITLLVFLLLGWGLLRQRSAETPGKPLGNGFIVAFGIVMPAIVLVGLLIANLRTTLALRDPETALTIRVVGKQFWWHVEYPDHGIISANELYIPVGVSVRVELRSDNVIHSFWVPRLGGKMDMIPGIELTNYVLRADKPGRYRGQCAEYCGIQHALMAFYVVALQQEEFDQWIAQRRRPPAPPADEHLQRGKAVYAAHACGNCHAIRGTEFSTRIGPDLTHIGSRLTLGAGTLPNNRGNLEGWISNPQPIKPGNFMPPSYLSPDELHALTDYLWTLK